MDDNENFLEFPKMNFSPFSNQFTNVNQFAKFTQNLTTANGQVLSLVSSGDNGMQFLRNLPTLDPNGNTASAFQAQANAAAAAANLASSQTFLTLPITMPGTKPGEAQQTVQIQVLNPNPIAPQMPKFQMGQMQIPIQGFQQGTTVLTVAYTPQDGELVHNHNLNEGVTVLAAIQPQDLQLLAQQAQQSGMVNQQLATQQATATHQDNNDDKEMNRMVNIKSEPVWNQNPITISAAPHQLTTDLNEYLAQRAHGVNLQQFLKFNTTEPPNINIKKEIFEDHNMNGGNTTNDSNASTNDCENESNASNNNNNNNNSNNNNHMVDDSNLNDTNASDEQQQEEQEMETDSNGKIKKKRKTKKKPPKPKRPKPGQVHIATALDGTILFCCPECQMAYPEKESLEQHLVVHKIERRYICDICGAGLKRKEHLERHKLGHNPERPFVCAVCNKGFKRKEHLNLHAVIHSGQKTEICTECGKGFYRKDHLRKHLKSHMTKRLKEEAHAANAQNLNAQRKASNVMVTSTSTDTPSTSTNTVVNVDVKSQSIPSTSTTSVPICIPDKQTNITIHVPTSDNTTLPVQIQLPQIVTQTTNSDGSNNTLIIPS